MLRRHHYSSLLYRALSPCLHHRYHYHINHSINQLVLSDFDKIYGYTVHYNMQKSVCANISDAVLI